MPNQQGWPASVSFLHSNGSGRGRRGILTVLPEPWRISQGCPIAPATSPEDGEIEVWSFRDLLGIIWDQDSYWIIGVFLGCWDFFLGYTLRCQTWQVKIHKTNGGLYLGKSMNLMGAFDWKRCTSPPRDVSSLCFLFCLSRVRCFIYSLRETEMSVQISEECQQRNQPLQRRTFCWSFSFDFCSSDSSCPCNLGRETCLDFAPWQLRATI